MIVIFTESHRASRRVDGRFAPAGFSLVEVALAVAIAALAIITLLGLMPQGLEMSRKTGTLTINSNIVEQIIRDLENTDFSLLPTQQTGGTQSGGANAIKETSRRYFNDQGQEEEEDSKEIAFVAEIDFTQRASLPEAEQLQPYLRRVVVRIAASANPQFQFGANNRLSYAIFNHLLAKTR